MNECGLVASFGIFFFFYFFLPNSIVHAPLPHGGRRAVYQVFSFQLNYKSECGGIYKDAEGYIMSPNHPNEYSNNMNCNYSILASSESYVILNFTAMDIEGKQAKMTIFVY